MPARPPDRRKGQVPPASGTGPDRKSSANEILTPSEARAATENWKILPISPCLALLELRERNLLRLGQQQLVQRVHSLGPAPLQHFLEELAEEAGCGTTIEHLMRRYAGVDPSVVHALGDHKFPPRPLYTGEAVA